MRVYEDRVTMPSGKDGIYGFVESTSDSMYIVPVDSEGNSYLVKQEHYTTREMAWQCPAGRTDGEDPVIAAQRELLEEAGLKARSITILSSPRVAMGMTTFRGTICLARDLEPDTNLLDKEEGIMEVKKLPLASIKKMILDGEINNTESIAAYLLEIAYLEKEA
ncbi:MAG TPA: NUDIX hydrolase [Candidatus Saccharimonadales bacterium]|nr:NUDIX hydrolase [Candidatus Saccharimonadales bacterium]